MIREYQEAEREGAVLTARDLHHLGATYLARGDHDLALARAQSIPDENRGMRDELYRGVVNDWLTSAVPRRDKAMDLLTQMLTDPTLPVEDRVWAMSRRAGVQIEQGATDEAIATLLKALPRIEESADASALASVHLTLAQAYLKNAAYRDAERHVERVLEIAPPEDAARPEAMLIGAKVHEARGELVEARDLYQEVDERFASSPAYAPALLGLAQVQAGLESTEASLETYERLIEYLKTFPLTARPTREEIADSLLGRYLDEMTVREHELALRYATLAEELYPGGKAPALVTQAVAEGHEAAANDLLGPLDWDGEPTVEDPGKRAEAQRHLLRSARAFRTLADDVVLTDNQAYADALWQSARQFDMAGDLESAIGAYQEYAEGVPGDPRQPEARYRLGRAYHARGEYELAEQQYESLVRDERDGNGAFVGAYATRARVPLAECLLLDNDATNDASAEELLLDVVSGARARVDSPQYRDAVAELGSVYYRDGRYERAIERFEEALARYPSDPARAGWAYQLADSRRLLADEIEASLNEPMPESERRDRRAQVSEHRRAALKGFGQTRDLFDAREAGSMTELDRLHQRNACFYMGDCAFDLGDFDTAIADYDAARERYPKDPASLVAMVQIVNAYVEMGDLRRAQTANERAKRFYMNLPPEAWNDPNLPMDRKDWERWLESSAMLYELAGRADTTGGG
ncbi:MAG: tetratricopeptide repeat protein [Phycisphaerales bacterium]